MAITITKQVLMARNSKSACETIVIPRSTAPQEDESQHGWLIIWPAQKAHIPEAYLIPTMLFSDKALFVFNIVAKEP